MKTSVKYLKSFLLHVQCTYSKIVVTYRAEQTEKIREKTSGQKGSEPSGRDGAQILAKMVS